MAGNEWLRIRCGGVKPITDRGVCRLRRCITYLKYFLGVKLRVLDLIVICFSCTSGDTTTLRTIVDATSCFTPLVLMPGMMKTQKSSFKFTNGCIQVGLFINDIPEYRDGLVGIGRIDLLFKWLLKKKTKMCWFTALRTNWS